MTTRVSTTTRSNSTFSSQPSSRKQSNDPITQKNAQSSATCLYQAPIAGFWRNVTILWCKNLMNYSLTITVESVDRNRDYTCKIDLKPWHFWAKKGYKSFEVDGNNLEAYWDLRSAKFSGSAPEPCSDFYVALVSEDEVVLLLGDCEKKVYKRLKLNPAVVDALMLYKKEHVFGKKSFSTKVRFDKKKREHEIVVESSTSGPRGPEMWISIDGIVLIHIKNLQWKFRGNETVLVNKHPVQVFWDVHAWLFCAPGSNYGMFIFKPGGAESDSDAEEYDVDDGDDDGRAGDESDCSGPSKYYSTRSYSNSKASSGFCLFLYAWRIE